MIQRKIKFEKGFTIIEVVLVLAIAGLIFLMVFVALPNLQKNQRDAQRRNDIGRMYTAVMNYITNNKTLPQINAMNNNNGEGRVTITINGGEIIPHVNNDLSKQWVNFVKEYILVGGDTFDDPSGTPYRMRFTSCGKLTNNANENCNITGERGSIDEFNKENPTMFILEYARCHEDAASGSGGSGYLYRTEGRNQFAVLMRLEGGVYCLDNS